MPVSIFWIKTVNNLILNSEIEEFLSQQNYEVTKIKIWENILLIKLTSYPQFKQNDVKTYCAIFFIFPISVDAFFIKMGKKIKTAFYTFICCPASNNYLINLKIFLTSKVLPVISKSWIVLLNLSNISGIY